MRPSVRDRFKESFALADANAKRCPVEMGGPGCLDLIYWTAEWLQAMRVIETGTAYGWSSLAVLLSLKNREGSRLISTDRPYLGRDNDPYVGCVVPDDLRSHWQILRQADREALPKALAQLPLIDLCHYDSDKSVGGRRWAYPRLWKALRHGGCFLSDDISDNLAFRDFCRQVAVEPIIVRVPDPFFRGEKYVGVLIKATAAAPATS
ncbi:MAG: class I SAM-dependent methyltransferase [Planctomycetia bacterium]|nr:class I SAM-dependent methyltransferase [Planctomycetia bacterium]